MDDRVKILESENAFLTDQLRKLTAIIRQQEDQISDLSQANQDLKYQLIERSKNVELPNSKS